MSAMVGDISWWTALRCDQRQRIADIRAAVNASELAPFAVAVINQWIDEAHQAWRDCDTPGVEHNLEIARARLDSERKWVEP